MANISVKLVKSLIGSTDKQKATAAALGLHKIGDRESSPTMPRHRVRLKDQTPRRGNQSVN